jgi:hypothetical protein
MVVFLLLLIAPLSPIGGEGLSFSFCHSLAKNSVGMFRHCPRTGSGVLLLLQNPVVLQRQGSVVAEALILVDGYRFGVFGKPA